MEGSKPPGQTRALRLCQNSMLIFNENVAWHWATRIDLHTHLHRILKDGPKQAHIQQNILSSAVSGRSNRFHRPDFNISLPETLRLNHRPFVLLYQIRLMFVAERPF